MYVCNQIAFISFFYLLNLHGHIQNCVKILNKLLLWQNFRIFLKKSPKKHFGTAITLEGFEHKLLLDFELNLSKRNLIQFIILYKRLQISFLKLFYLLNPKKLFKTLHNQYSSSFLIKHVSKAL